MITKNGVGEIKQLDERADPYKGFRRQESIKQSSRAEKPNAAAVRAIVAVEKESDRINSLNSPWFECPISF